MFRWFRRSVPLTAQERLLADLNARANRVFSRQDNMGFAGAVSDQYREFAGQAYLSLISTVKRTPQDQHEAPMQYATRLRPEFERLHQYYRDLDADEDGGGLGSVSDGLSLLDRL